MMPHPTPITGLLTPEVISILFTQISLLFLDDIYKDGLLTLISHILIYCKMFSTGDLVYNC